MSIIRGREKGEKQHGAGQLMLAAAAFTRSPAERD
jgi:hypothetical protein